MQTILITGANGLLGQSLVRVFSGTSHVVATGRQASLLPAMEGVRYRPLDIGDAQACREVVDETAPDIIINAAAYTHVDGCEREREQCWRVNVKGVAHLAYAARKHMAQLIHLSTDYLFDGETGPYDENARPAPLGYYGKAKLASENAVRTAGIPYAIVRTNVIFGAGVDVKSNFFLWIYRSLVAGKAIRVVTDQYNNPVLADDLATGIRQLVEASRYGVYHLAGADYMNRFVFARTLADVFDLDAGLVEPITTDALEQAAPRPRRGGLRIERARADFGYVPRPLTEAFRFLKSHGAL